MAEEKPKRDRSASPRRQRSLLTSSSNAIYVDKYAECGGTEITKNVTLFTPIQLQMRPDVPDMEYVFGLENLKNTLDNCILMPLKAPSHFTIRGGKLNLERVFFQFGGRGSGKKTLDRAFCAKNFVNYVEISFAGFDPKIDIPAAYECAEKNQPCMIVFNECEGHFMPNSSLLTINSLHVALNRVEHSDNRIWSVFVSTVKPSLNNLSWAIYQFIKVPIEESWAGILNYAERMKVFLQAIASKMYPNQVSPIDKKVIADIVGLTDNCVSGDIVEYVERVFMYKIRSVGITELAVRKRDDAYLLPTESDFEKLLLNPGGGVPKRITQMIPYDVNVKPYKNIAINGKSSDASAGAYGFPQAM